MATEDMSILRVRSTVGETMERQARAHAGHRWFQTDKEIPRDEWVEAHWQEYAGLLRSFIETLDFDGYVVMSRAAISRHVRTGTIKWGEPDQRDGSHMKVGSPTGTQTEAD